MSAPADWRGVSALWGLILRPACMAHTVIVGGGNREVRTAAKRLRGSAWTREQAEKSWRECLRIVADDWQNLGLVY